MNPSTLCYTPKEALSMTLRGRKEPISNDFMRKKGRDLYEHYVHLQLHYKLLSLLYIIVPGIILLMAAIL